jgi:hypothetical protein
MPAKNATSVTYDTMGQEAWTYPDEHANLVDRKARPGDKMRSAIGDTAYEVLTDIASAGVPSRGAARQGARLAKLVGEAMGASKHMPYPKPSSNVTEVHSLAAPQQVKQRQSDEQNEPNPVATGGISPGVQPMDHHLDFMRRRRRRGA